MSEKEVDKDSSFNMSSPHLSPRAIPESPMSVPKGFSKSAMSGSSLYYSRNSVKSNGFYGFGQLTSSSSMPHLSIQMSRTASAPHYHSRMATIHNRASADKEEAANQTYGWSSLDLGGMNVRNLSKPLFQFSFLTALYLNHNALTFIPPEIARLSALTCLNLCGNQLKTVPPEMGRLVLLKELLLFDNQINTLPSELGFLYLMEVFGLDGNPLIEPLFSLNIKQGPLAVLSFLRDNYALQPPNTDRAWIPVDQDSNSNESFTIFNYNVLCDKYATPQSHGYTASWALAWDYRKELILQEILLYNADIVCLQEVETSQYEEFFSPQLRSRGEYEGVFWPKSRARTMSDWERKAVDGCAIFYKPQKFRLEDQCAIEFSQLALSKQGLRKSEDVYNRIMNRDNVALIIRLDHKELKKQIIVANVHIHWDPAYKDVKLLQSIMLLEELEKQASLHPKAAILACGDFNSLPNSGVYELMSQGTLKESHEDFCKYTYEPYTTEGFSHSLALKSAYSSIGEPAFTNYTPLFKGTIDYIWYRSSSLALTGLLGPISEEYISRVIGLPSPHFPSDHVSQLAEFKIKNHLANVSTQMRRGVVPKNNKNFY